jgi:hypothetical protein
MLWECDRCGIGPLDSDRPKSAIQTALGEGGVCNDEGVERLAFV